MYANLVNETTLLDSVFKQRFGKNYEYVSSLRTDNLLRKYLLEAGLWSYSGNSSTTIDPEEQLEDPSNWHWGWESVTSELGGHFLGHWLSAASKIYRETSDPVIFGKMEEVLNGLSQCQEANGNGWVASIPEKYMKKMEQNEPVWAPHYTIHKTMMGLFDVYKNTGNKLALRILINFSKWFIRWCKEVDEETFQNILSYETGGMIEIWAELLSETRDDAYQKLIDQYYRHSFFDNLLEGKDVLTNKHANTQILEVLGIARAYEVTGNDLYREITEKFWQEAVTERGTYVTGGVSCGELWTNKQDLANRLGQAQEHCTVYHMIRLAQTLFRWTGNSKYADFEELNLFNGILAQQNKNTGMVSYFLDMEPCSKKNWGEPLKHFWCCHGTLVQAQAAYTEGIFYQKDREIIISQFIPSHTVTEIAGCPIHITLKQDTQCGSGSLIQSNKKGKQVIQSYEKKDEIPKKRPNHYRYSILIESIKQTNFQLKIRIPNWTKRFSCFLEGEKVNSTNDGYIVIEQPWKNNTIELEFFKEITIIPLLGDSERIAFRDGPLVLAGITEKDQPLSFENIENLFKPLNERHHSFWRDSAYITSGQHENIKFLPIAVITNQIYSIYFENDSLIRN